MLGWVNVRGRGRPRDAYKAVGKFCFQDEASISHLVSGLADLCNDVVGWQNGGIG